MSKEDKKKYYIFEMNIKVLNIVSIAIFILLILLSYLIVPKIADLTKIDLVSVLIFYIVYMLLHELLHSLGYVLHGANFKNIVYGAYLEKGVLYCLCKQNITRRNILNSLLFPFFYIGIVTYIIAIIFNIPMLLYLSILNISGCAGDILMFLYIIKLNKDIEFSEFDNPIQFAIQSNEDVSKISHFGLNYIQETSTLSRKVSKKVSISKGTIITIIILAIIVLLEIIL